MSNEKKPPTETLKTKGQPRDILARIRPAFREHIRPLTRKETGESLGGGSVLNARWDHRLSRDLDVHLQLTTTKDRRAVLDRAADACGGYRIEHPQFRRIEFERNKENHVDVSFDAPTPRGGETTAIVDGEPTSVLSTAQIMSGKLWGRGMHGPARDLVDIAACGKADPEALEIAVNGLPEKSLNAILTIYKETERQYRKEAGQLEGVADELAGVIDNPTAYANNAILAAKYARFEIRTHDGAVEIETTTSEGTRTRRYDSAEALQAGLERDGANAFLEAQERDAAAVLDATIDALWMNRSETVIRIEPEKLTHERENVPPIEWTPAKQGKESGERERDSQQKVQIGDQAPEPQNAPTRATETPRSAGRKLDTTRNNR